MGLDAYTYYQCSFRPGGAIDQIQAMQQGLSMLNIMVQHGVPSVTFRAIGPSGPEDREVTREEAERAASAMGHLEQACAACPASGGPSVPGCMSRIDYPLDPIAVEILRETLVAHRDMCGDEDSVVITALVDSGNCDGSRMSGLLAQLGDDVSMEAGNQPVAFRVRGVEVGITPFMLMEHMFFRPILNEVATAQLREIVRAFHVALGDRLQAGPNPDPGANAPALFDSSPSLGQLAAFARHVKTSAENNWGLMLDG